MAQTWHSGHRPPPSRRTRWGIYSRETEETCGSRISRALNAQRIAQYLSPGLIGILLPGYQPAQHSWSNIQPWNRIILGNSTVWWNYFLVVLLVFNVFSQPFLWIIGNNMRSKAGHRQKNDGQLESSIKVQSAAVFQREALAGVLAQETPGEPLALFTTELFTNLQEKHQQSLL